MSIDEQADKKNVAFEFTAVTLPPALAIIELVRHLARISAENDYNAFLKTLETRYRGGRTKGPPQ